jgi:hypothetical protein
MIVESEKRLRIERLTGTMTEVLSGRGSSTSKGAMSSSKAVRRSLPVPGSAVAATTNRSGMRSFSVESRAPLHDGPIAARRFTIASRLANALGPFSASRTCSLPALSFWVSSRDVFRTPRQLGCYDPVRQASLPNLKVLWRNSENRIYWHYRYCFVRPCKLTLNPSLRYRSDHRSNPTGSCSAPCCRPVRILCGVQ